MKKQVLIAMITGITQFEEDLLSVLLNIALRKDSLIRSRWYSGILYLSTFVECFVT